MSEPDRLLSMSLDQFLRQTSPLKSSGFTVVYNGVAYAYAFANKAAAKAYWAGLGDFVSWYDTNTGLSVANTTASGGGSARALRPSATELIVAGASLRCYFPMDRKVWNGTVSKFCSYPPEIAIGGASVFGDAGASDGGAVITPQTGHYDYAFSGSRRLDEGSVSYPTGIFTVFRAAWFRRLALNAGNDLFCNLLGGGNQFGLLLGNPGGLINAVGYAGSGYLFPENDGPPYVKTVGAFPNDLLDHHVAFTLTNDTANVVPSVLKVWVDNVLQGTFVGRPGAYFGDANKAYSYLGGNSGTAGGQQLVVSDLVAYDGDASALIPRLAQ